MNTNCRHYAVEYPPYCMKSGKRCNVSACNEGWDVVVTKTVKSMACDNLRPITLHIEGQEQKLFMCAITQHKCTRENCPLSAPETTEIPESCEER